MQVAGHLEKRLMQLRYWSESATSSLRDEVAVANRTTRNRDQEQLLISSRSLAHQANVVLFPSGLGAIDIAKYKAIARLRFRSRLMRMSAMGEPINTIKSSSAMVAREAGGRGFAMAPAPDSFRRADGTCVDRLALEKTVQLIRQFLRGGVTFVRLFFETLEADRFQIARQARIQQPRRHWLRVEHLVQCVRQRFAPKGRAAVSR